MNAAVDAAGAANEAGASENAPGSSTTKSRTPQWLAMTLAVLFGLFFAYDVWEGLGNLVGMLTIANELGLGLSVLGWIVLLTAMLLPIALFGLAFWLGYKRPPLQQIALYLAALAVSAALYLGVYTVFGPVTLFA